MSPEDVVRFWTEAGPKSWFKKDEDFDALIKARFEAWHLAASRRELDDWARTPAGALALLLLLDQFPRNMYRNSAHAYATDPLARHVADEALKAGHDKAVDRTLMGFFYLPFEHSEALADQDRSCDLCEASGDADLAHWATLHRGIIQRFGRFPHRNAELGRQTTPREQEFLQSGGFAG